MLIGWFLSVTFTYNNYYHNYNNYNNNYYDNNNYYFNNNYRGKKLCKNEHRETTDEGRILYR